MKRFLPLLFLGSLALSPARGEGESLASQATDPTASLMALKFQARYTGGFHGASLPGEADEALEFRFQPVIPFEAFGMANILRLTVPFQVEGRGEEGFGPISLFDLVVFPEEWGRWGIGPVMSLDPSGNALDDFVLGPAIGGVLNVTDRLKLGLFSQNVFWSDTAVSQIQPVVAYQLGDGWSLTAGDLQWTYDWKASRWVDLPVGFQLGKVARIGKQPVRFAINPQYNLKNDRGLSEWSVTLEFTALFPSF